MHGLESNKTSRVFYDASRASCIVGIYFTGDNDFRACNLPKYLWALMADEKIIEINNRTAQKAKLVFGMHAVMTAAAQLDTVVVDCSSSGSGHLACGARPAVISAEHGGDIYYAQSVPFRCRVCVRARV